ncbi:hypothetical protein E2C01_022329 [Portunus trituberculatus]|uniref:Uncharacterized protein n=1 Tax=Portunus trituberculatus TaxID=210409 RepID=A0A5B7E550_PORTR|nr:hypothetical protein [Portunus trituberculatus]
MFIEGGLAKGKCRSQAAAARRGSSEHPGSASPRPISVARSVTHSQYSIPNSSFSREIMLEQYV